MQQSGGLLLAGFHPGDTIIFAKGENANQIPPSPLIAISFVHFEPYYN
jgi:hypothetical protein